MSEFTLDVRLDNFSRPIGKLRRLKSGDTQFFYTTEHLSDPLALPVSLSLPLREEPYGDVASRAFFSNLLQERDQPLQQVMEQFAIERSDIAGLLFHLGADCAGALSVLPEGDPPIKIPGNPNTDYDPVSAADMNAIVRALHERKPLPSGMRDASPLAGVQSKLSVFYDEKLGFALPKSGLRVPTTHVIKVPERGHLNDGKLEHYALRLSTDTGIRAVSSYLVEFEVVAALVTERFDRRHDVSENIFTRQHQEDFAQTLGLGPSLKYERNGITGRRFDADAIARVLDQTSNPAYHRRLFFDGMIFDLLIGNCDAHAKNHALLYLPRLGGRGGKHPELAPRYDLLPSRLDPTLTDELPYRIGNASRFQDIESEDISIFMNTLGVTGKPAQRRLIESALRRITRRLTLALEELDSLRQKNFADLIAGNMRGLLPKLNFPIPQKALNRDAFFQRGGGWLTS
jgi:serine/threonine-protein kinase HipA